MVPFAAATPCHIRTHHARPTAPCKAHSPCGPQYTARAPCAINVMFYFVRLFYSNVLLCPFSVETKRAPPLHFSSEPPGSPSAPSIYTYGSLSLRKPPSPHVHFHTSPAILLPPRPQPPRSRARATACCGGPRGRRRCSSRCVAVGVGEGGRGWHGGGAVCHGRGKPPYTPLSPIHPAPPHAFTHQPDTTPSPTRRTGRNYTCKARRYWTTAHTDFFLFASTTASSTCHVDHASAPNWHLYASFPSADGLRFLPLSRWPPTRRRLNVPNAAALRLFPPPPPSPHPLQVAPDLSEPDKRDIAAVALACRVDGLIVSNTTIQRPGGAEWRW